MFSLSISIGNVLYSLNRTLVKGWERSSRQNVRCAFSNAPHDRVYDHVLVCAGTSQVNLTRQTDKLCIKARCVLRPVPKLAQGSTDTQQIPLPKREETQGVSDFRSSLTIRSDTNHPNRKGEEMLHGFPQDKTLSIRFDTTQPINSIEETSSRTQSTRRGSITPPVSNL